MTAVAEERARQPSWQWLSGLRMPVLTAIAYYAGAEAAFAVGTLSDKLFAPFWPPNIVLFCALLFAPPRRWPLFIAACALPHFLAEYGVGMPAGQASIAFATNCLVALANAVGLRMASERSELFTTFGTAGLYVFVTVIAAPAVAALAGAFVQISGGGAAADYGHFWAQWYASNALGAATLGPLAIVILQGRFRAGWQPLSNRSFEALATLAALIFVSILSFQVTPKTVTATYLPTLLYLPLPLVLWAAVRFGVGAASAAVLTVGAILLWNSLNGSNLFTVSDPETNVFSFQIFLIGLAVPILLLSAAIEETRRAHREARESEERMSFAAAASDVGLWLYNYTTRKFWATEHSRAMFGVPHSRPLETRELLARIDPDDRDMANSAMRRTIRDRVAMDIEFRVLGRDGKTRWISTRARPHESPDGTGSEMTGTFSDITARKQAEEEAARKQQEIAHLMRVSMLGELSAGLAHELTQPLTAILSNAQAGRMLLDQPDLDMDEVSNIFDDIIAADARAGDVIQRLRTLLRKGDIRYEAVDINALIEATLQLLHSELIKRRTTVKLDLDPDLLPARGDAVQLQQILLNLLINAMDAMEEMSPSRRTVSIRTRMNGANEIDVRIVDRGIGLGQSHKQVFQPFFTTKNRGLGLGLSICATIIKSHGGTLSLEDNAGDGATATFRLPPQRI